MLETRKDAIPCAHNFEEFLEDIVKSKQDQRRPSKPSMEKQCVLAINVGSTAEHRQAKGSTHSTAIPQTKAHTQGPPSEPGAAIPHPGPQPGHHVRQRERHMGCVWYGRPQCKFSQPNISPVPSLGYEKVRKTDTVIAEEPIISCKIMVMVLKLCSD